tara:strand:- start:209 stop:1018 length:810 start_codon:yes stop_codon:yes gene_type:complete
MPTKTNNESPLEKEGRIGSVIGGLAGGVGGFFLGGPAGAKLGFTAGSAIGRTIGQSVDERQKKRGTGPYKEGGRLEDERFANADQTPGTTYIQTNINPYTGEEYQPYGMSPFGMTEKPKIMKALTPYTASYSAYNMSAKQASKEPLMQKLSGVSSLQFTDKGLEKLSAANIGGKFGAIVEAEKNKRAEKSPATMKRPVANTPKADKTRVNMPTGFKSNKELEEERSVQEHIDLAKSSWSDYAGYRSGDARNFKLISLGIKEHMEKNKKD